MKLILTEASLVLGKKLNFHADINDKNSVGNWFEDLLIWKWPCLGNNFKTPTFATGSLSNINRHPHKDLCWWSREHTGKSELNRRKWGTATAEGKTNYSNYIGNDPYWILYSSCFEKTRLLSLALTLLLCLVGTTRVWCSQEYTVKDLQRQSYLGNIWELQTFGAQLCSSEIGSLLPGKLFRAVEINLS